jgi:hypothetical protein
MLIKKINIRQGFISSVTSHVSVNECLRTFREFIGHLSSSTVGLFGCETWSLTLREERRLRVFENRVLKRIFGPKMEEVTEEWRKIHNELTR